MPRRSLQGLVSHAIDFNCNGCHACFKTCPTNAIVGKPKELHYIDQAKCIQCGACYQICKYDAIKRVKRGVGDSIQTTAREMWRPSAKLETASMA